MSGFVRSELSIFASATLAETLGSAIVHRLVNVRFCQVRDVRFCEVLLAINVKF